MHARCIRACQSRTDISRSQFQPLQGGKESRGTYRLPRIGLVIIMLCDYQCELEKQHYARAEPQTSHPDGVLGGTPLPENDPLVSNVLRQFEARMRRTSSPQTSGSRCIFQTCTSIVVAFLTKYFPLPIVVSSSGVMPRLPAVGVRRSVSRITATVLSIRWVQNQRLI